MNAPYLKSVGDKKILMVRDQPVILLAGEVHNSNSSSATYMEPVWKKAGALGMNCLLLPVSWEMIEPKEGEFHFTIVDQLVEQARIYGMKIVFLWFGSWKNAECMYAPAWVKQDMERFPRAQIAKGENKSILPGKHPRPYTSLSYLGQETIKADSRAFAALLSHIHGIDETEQTVVAVQVENETGLLGTARERSDLADAIFDTPVPPDFAAYMREHMNQMTADVRAAVENGAAGGSWQEVFGSVAEEVFSAYHIAAAVEKVAKAGKAQYELPMIVNCWLDKPGDVPGDYPSGGPVARMHCVWRFCAPSIDVFTPDIYVPYFCDVCDTYASHGNPLFIPEAATHSYAGARQVYVIGHYHALGYSPFGFEDIGNPFTMLQGVLFGMDVTDPALKTPQNVEEYAAYNKYLRQLMPMIAERYGTADLQAVSGERPEDATLRFGSFGVSVLTQLPMRDKTTGVCLGMKTGENECYLLVNQCILRLQSLNPEKPQIEILDMEEGYLEDNHWHMTRRLNGDETTFMLFEEVTLLRLRVQVFA